MNLVANAMTPGINDVPAVSAMGLRSLGRRTLIVSYYFTCVVL